MIGQITKELADKIADGLSEKQREAVFSDARYLRIVAAAGAGKTETITRRILYLLAQGEDPTSIVAFTFTERAAQEMKERIYLKTEQILGQESCARLGDMYIGTIHAFAMFILQEYFGYGNYDVLDQNKEMAFILREGWGLGLGPGAKLAVGRNYAENCDMFLSSASVVYDELLDRALLLTEAPDFAAKLEEYEELLERHRLVTFGRMIYLVTNHLEEQPEILRHYKHLIVDEYQDINRAQEKLIELLSIHASCYVVGDPRQCIYQWRGSDPDCFMRFSKRYSAATVEIARNRRSTKTIVNVGNDVAKELSDRSLRQPMECMRDEDGVASLFVHDTPEDEARWISTQVNRLVEEGICRFQDVAILLRSVSTSGPAILDALGASDIPYIVGGKVGLFRRGEAQVLGAIFTWCADLDWPLDPWGQQVINAQQVPAYAAAQWPNRFKQDELDLFKQALLDGWFKNFTEAYQELLVILGVLDWNPDDPQEAVRLANLGRFNTLITDYETARRLGGRWNNWTQDVRNLAWFILSYAQAAYEEQSADDLRGVDAVQVMTVHQAKGLEWPVLFVPALVDRRFGRTRDARRWLIPTNLFDSDRYDGTEDDERKLFYVAVTRARDGLCLSHFRRQQKQAAASRFLTSVNLQPSTPTDEPFIRHIRLPTLADGEVLSYSAGEIIDYLRCPHLYRLRNIWGYQPGLVAELGFGKTIHHILHMLADKAKLGHDPEKDIDRLVDVYFHLPFAPAGEAKALKETARTMLRRFVAVNKKDFRAIEEVEARLEFRLARMGNKVATITGRVDVILSPDGKRHLRDYKTAQEPGDGDVDNPRVVEESTVQISIYAMGEQSLGRSVDMASVAFLRSGVLKPVPLDMKSLDSVRGRIVDAVENILQRRFSGGECNFCPECDFRRICQFGSRKNTKRRPHGRSSHGV